jgi:CIC family chloride channel protein
MPMCNDKQDEESRDEVDGSLLKLGGLALFVGGLVGLMCAAFRLALVQADQLRDNLVTWAQGASLVGLLLLVAGCATAAAIAAWLVRRFSPHASGSGIPHVEAVLHKELPQAPYRLIPVKFVGGLLAIGSGLALGREGPSVQMGASLAHLLGRVFGCSSSDCLTLLAGGAGAGLATAFNAPIAGAVFVLEELVRRFDARIAIGTFGASAGAIAVSRLFLGDLPDFHVAPLPYPGFATVPLYLLLGMLAGLAGIAYNRAILGALAVTERLPRWPVEVRAAVIGASVGLVAWFSPSLVGGGDLLTSKLSPPTKRFRGWPWLFCSASQWVRCVTRRRRQGGCSPPCSCWASRAACCAGSSAATGLLTLPRTRELWPWSGWRPFSPQSCVRH